MLPTNTALLFVLVVSLLTSGFNLAWVLGPVPITFADDGDKKECKNNEGGNNCNDSKKSASPELECKHQIKDNKDSTIDSQCTNNSQILIDSNIASQPSDGVGGIRNPSIELSPTSGPTGTLVNVTGTGYAPLADIVIIFDGTILFLTSANIDGELNTEFKVPTSTAGPRTVEARQLEQGGLITAFATFTVTSSLNPAIASSQGMLPF